MTLISRSLAPTFHASLRPLARHWAALLALALFLIAGLAVLDDYGVPLDEYTRALRAERNYAFLVGADDSFASADFPAEVYGPVFRLYGPAFDLALLFVERGFGIDAMRGVHLSRHLLIHLCFLAGGLFAYLLALRLLRNRLLALFAAGLFLLHPRLYAHSFLNGKDITFLVAFIAALYLTRRAFKDDTLPAFALLGAAVGALVNLRIMGLVLVAAIPAVRALDMAFASGREERKRILVTTWAFALAAPLAAYALLPYLWGDPVGRAVEWWAGLSNHPQVPFELFRGTLYRSVDFPVEYLPVWFSITAPPFALLLGVVGAAGILVRAARAPRDALRNGGVRFALLLVGCFAAPVAAALLLDANMYNGWRQMHFLWAPFALLGAFGLQRLVSALRGMRLRATAYGAASAGLAAAVISMGLIHPNQQVSFNFLVDRVAPEHLRWQYAMDYWTHAIRQGLERVVERSAESSGEPTAITASRPIDPYAAANALILPESGRERLANAAPFDIVPNRRLESWSRSARELHRVEAYESTLWSVESRDDLREVYEAVRGREPLMDGAFDVHRVDGALALVMEPCAPPVIESEQSVAILRAFPVDAGDLPAWRRGKTFEPRVFHLRHYGAYFDGKCVASLPLPAYPVADFELRGLPELMDAAEGRERARRAREEGRLLARGFYDVYLADGELAYLRDSCDPLETAQPFHLNVYPEDAGDLPAERRERGFERFHFEFLSNGAFADGGCVAFFRLPGYPVAAIQTGQLDGEGGDLWYAEFWTDPEGRWAESASGASGEPVGRGVFDVYLSDGALVYVKEPCERTDTDARFFLHIVPERVRDLPDGRRARGFDNLDFAFFPNGALFEGSCAARISLPEYAVASVRTGQHAGVVGEMWSAEFSVGR